jgi:hypothetical protein
MNKKYGRNEKPLQAVLQGLNLVYGGGERHGTLF